MEYSWGRAGPDSYISRFLGAAPDARPKAELWMGAHPKAPSRITLRNKERLDLMQAIRKAPKHFLGPVFAKKQKEGLPFLLKILDAAEPLSIQAHPDSALAQALHQERPQHYPDPFAKAELAVCIQKMRALVGFRPSEEAVSFLRRNKDMAQLCNYQGGAQVSLKELYTTLMQAPALQVQEAAHSHYKALQSAALRSQIEDQLFLLFVEKHGLQDPSVFSPYLLNYIELAAGEALFLAPKQIHSYLEGVILECMSSSDNVVRAGLTQKYRDLPTLLDMLDYSHDVERLRPCALEKACFGQMYAPKGADFCLYSYDAAAKEAFSLKDLHYPSILLLLSGEESQDMRRKQAELYVHVRGQTAYLSKYALEKASILFLPGDLHERKLELRLELSYGQAFRALSRVACGLEPLPKHAGIFTQGTIYKSP